MSTELTTIEAAEFATLRATVARTKDAAAEFYDALTQIHTRRLYRQDFATWDDFWSGSKSEALLPK